MEKEQHSAGDVIKEIEAAGESVVSSVKDRIEGIVNPFRKSAFERFPVLFMLLGTFGAAAVIYGFEGMLAQVAIFEEQPWLMVVAGVVVLYVTGKLYKKLS